MAGFDDPGLYNADRIFADEDENQGGNVSENDLREAKKEFGNFIRSYSYAGLQHPYRDELRRRYNLGEYSLTISTGDIAAYDSDLAEKLKRKPALYLPVLEETVKEHAEESTRPRPKGQEEMEDIQVLMDSPDYPQNIRSIKSAQVSQLVKVSGIIIAASQVRSKASTISLQCRSCRHAVSNIPLKPGLEGYALPRKCGADQTGLLNRCPIDPYFIVPDKCKCVDFQTLKLQENPEDVPHGELPRHLQLYAENYLTDQVAPGNRVTLVGVYSIRKTNVNKQNRGAAKPIAGIRAPYLRVLGIQVDTRGPGRSEQTSKLSGEEEEEFRQLARNPDIYQRIAKSIAPSIFGSEDIKKAIACLLFGGSRKRMPDGLTRRGDINVLLLGDPGTAKSQLLKFVERVAPIGVYTSGKGSSAAGLTASVIRDPASKNFMMEGGAMVLADGGVVCIDEFDKMREDDRVAIHEAMEQQTISIAKAGITTTLNSRCSVLAAANSVFGRWDDTKGKDNVDFMPTILSRFDMIFIVKDEHNEARDKTLARHVISVHVNAVGGSDEAHPEQEGELSLATLKNYVGYCRAKCGPRLHPSAAHKLVNHYVKLRNPDQDSENRGGRESKIPITVRQLEAIIRMSEGLAKMELKSFVSEKHVTEAFRLFQVSTLQAASSGTLAGIEGFTTEEDQENMSRVERQIKKRFSIGTQVSEHIIIQDFVRQNYKEFTIKQVLNAMIRRGDIQHRMQRKMLYRLQ